MGGGKRSQKQTKRERAFEKIPVAGKAEVDAARNRRAKQGAAQNLWGEKKEESGQISERRFERDKEVRGPCTGSLGTLQKY